MTDAPRYATHTKGRKALTGALLLFLVLGGALAVPSSSPALAQSPEEQDVSQGTSVGNADAQDTIGKCGDGFTGLLCSLKTFGTYVSTPSLMWKGFLSATFGAISGAVKLVFLGVSYGVNEILNTLMNLPVSPSHGEVPSAVRIGWEVSRDLVNLLFLTVLVFIGLATILDLPGYSYKKALPLFLVMVLLVNFSGLLVGLLADIGNIITNYFLQEMRTIAWANLQWKGPEVAMDQSAAAIVMTHLASIVYHFVGIFVFYAILLVFFIRTFVLWTLAIVAPFAFASYILPGTRSVVWNRWWKELIQWSIIGIPITFFMYLSALVLMYADVETAGLSTLANFMGPFTSLFLLFAGLAISMEFVPKGAAGAVAHAQGLGKKTAGSIRDWSKSKGREFLANRPRVQALATRMATMQTLGAGRRGVGGGILRSASAPVAGLVRWTGRQLGPNVIEAEKTAISSSQKAVEGKEAALQASAYQGATTEADRLGAIIAAHLAGNLNEVMGMIGDNVERDFPRLLQTAQRTGRRGDLLSAFPTLALQQGESMDDVFSRLKPDKLERSAGTIVSHYNDTTGTMPQTEARDLIQEMLARGTGAHMQKFIEGSPGRSGARVLEDFLDNYLLAHPITMPAGVTTQEQARFYALEDLGPRVAEWVRNNLGTMMLEVNP